MKIINGCNDSFCKSAANFARALVVAGFLLFAAAGRAQIAQPILTIAPLGTNEYSVTITNNVGSVEFDLQWTPVLANPAYPWTWAAVGSPGQTNYLVNVGSAYQTAFFRAISDTNSIPLWEAADPNNPAAGILNVWIDNPTNGMVLQ